MGRKIAADGLRLIVQRGQRRNAFIKVTCRAVPSLAMQLSNLSPRWRCDVVSDVGREHAHSRAIISVHIIIMLLIIISIMGMMSFLLVLPHPVLAVLCAAFVSCPAGRGLQSVLYFLPLSHSTSHFCSSLATLPEINTALSLSLSLSGWPRPVSVPIPVELCSWQLAAVSCHLTLD